jgi:hypothetical protein
VSGIDGAEEARTPKRREFFKNLKRVSKPEQ